MTDPSRPRETRPVPARAGSRGERSHAVTADLDASEPLAERLRRSDGDTDPQERTSFLSGGSAPSSGSPAPQGRKISSKSKKKLALKRRSRRAEISVPLREWQWITARYDGTCLLCDTAISEGTRCLWIQEHGIVCGRCFGYERYEAGHRKRRKK